MTHSSLSAAYGAHPELNNSTFTSYGELTTTGSVTNHLVWPDGQNLNVPDQTTGVQMTIVSTSANDDKDAGTGARTIEIHYLDINLEEKEEIVFLEGETSVLTVATDIRFINNMHIQTYGALKSTDGVVIATNAAIIYGYIDAKKIRNSSSARMVPKGYKLNILGMHGGAVSGTAAAKVVIRFFATILDAFNHTQDGLMVPFSAAAVQDSSVTLGGLPSYSFEEGIIVGFQCDADKAATVVAGFFGELEKV